MVRVVRTPVPRAALLQTAEQARSALELRTSDAARADLIRLYDWLVRPVRALVAVGGGRLVVVADGVLGVVPFAALLDRTTGRYLIEDHTLRFALSLRGAWARAPLGPTARLPALLIADPTLAPAAVTGLRPLGGARAEVRDLAGVYRTVRVLAGRDASAPAVLAELPRAAIVHYAGHALFDDERPMRSTLVLAPARERAVAGALTAERIAALSLGHVRLVVLSACETGRSSGTRAAGLAGLAGAFTAAGADGVLAALWRVDDEPTRTLMRAFHRAYASTGDAAGALRSAQRALLRDGDPAIRSPAAWAGFRYVGR